MANAFIKQVCRKENGSVQALWEKPCDYSPREGTETQARPYQKLHKRCLLQAAVRLDCRLVRCCKRKVAANASLIKVIRSDLSD